MPELSVIVPVYNTGTILKRSIAEILRQTYTDFELILVDDGSTDGSGAVCDEIATQDQRVSVIHKVNGGAGSARNAGIAYASGKYMMFPDADDFCKPEMFQTMLDAIKKYDADLAICSYETVKIDPAGNHVITNWQKLFDTDVHTVEDARQLWFRIRKLNISILNSPWNKIYKREIIEKYNVRFPDIRRAQDAVFNLCYYNSIGFVCVIDQCLYQYNANDIIRTGKKFPKDVYKCFVHYNRVMEEVITGWGMFYGEYKSLCDNNLLGNIDNCLEMTENPVWHLSKQEKIAYLQQITEDEYLQERLNKYSGTVVEVEDILDPFIKKDAKKILHKLHRRKTMEALRLSILGRIYRTLKRWI